MDMMGLGRSALRLDSDCSSCADINAAALSTAGRRGCQALLLLLLMPFGVGLPGADPVRRIVPLDDGWDFRLTDGTADGTSGPWSRVGLPHTWNVVDGSQAVKPYLRTIGIYRRALTMPEAWRGRPLFLTVGAANARAEIVLNGTVIGRHVTGFTSFTVDLTPHLRATPDQELQITVDNREDPDHPPIVSDYTFFGGIHRPVWLTITDPVHISLMDHSSPGVYLTQKHVTSGSAEIEAKVMLANDSDMALDDLLVLVDVLDQDGNTIHAARHAAPLPALARSHAIVPLSIAQPRLWDGRDDPYCYRVRIRLMHAGRITDEVTQPLGLRSFAIDADRGFLLNGRPYPLHGTSLHQDHAGKGWAISDADRATDVDLFSEIGATCVRLVHYPHAPATLHLFDRAGIVVWSEIPIAYRIGEAAAFEHNSRTMLTEMIHQLYNHPSICFWGLFNEVSSLRPESLRLIETLHHAAKELDPGRYTTGAAGAIENDPICDVPDVIAFNRYFGWFVPGENLLGPWADSSHRLYPQRRIGIAEYGGGGDPGRVRQERKPGFAATIGLDPQMGTEDDQSRLHEILWMQLEPKEYLWCKVSWTMADWATGGIKPPTPWANGGIGTMGLVTNDRKLKKDAFYWYKANWSREPVLHIVGRRSTPRAKRGFDLRIYSNLDTALTVTIDGRIHAEEPQRQGVRFVWPGITPPSGRMIVSVSAHVDGRTHSDEVAWEIIDDHAPPPVTDQATPPAVEPGFR